MKILLLSLYKKSLNFTSQIIHISLLIFFVLLREILMWSMTIKEIIAFARKLCVIIFPCDFLRTINFFFMFARSFIKTRKAHD